MRARSTTEVRWKSSRVELTIIVHSLRASATRCEYFVNRELNQRDPDHMTRNLFALSETKRV